MGTELHIPRTGLRKFVFELAEEHGISFKRSSLDDMVDAITELSGDSVKLDDVEELVVALGRANVIDDAQTLQILSNYIDEK